MSLHASHSEGVAAALSGACKFRGLTLPTTLPSEPMGMFCDWLSDAATAKIMPNPNAFSLATVNEQGYPAARIVLCRGVDAPTARIVFYTNYTGRKGKELMASGRAAALFHWDALERQVRIEGLVTKSPAAESDGYFNTRPKASRIAAWASDQSEPIGSRAEMEAKQRSCEERFGVRPGVDLEKDASVVVPRPPHWGGFRLWAQRVELWLGHPNRLHDRVVWERMLTAATVDGVPGFTGGAWRATRLQP